MLPWGDLLAKEHVDASRELGRVGGQDVVRRKASDDDIREEGGERSLRQSRSGEMIAESGGRGGVTE